MVCGPKVAHLVSEAQGVLKTKEKSEFCYYQQTPCFQKRFLNRVTNLTEEFHGLGNPFEDVKLVQISTQNVIDQFLIKTMGTVEDIGNGQLQEFTTERTD